jgi:molybdopterin molybdotransferase
LAEDIAADLDSPPHDKSIVDGYAVMAADLAGGSAELAILEEITAGALPTRTVSPGHCSRIMTGAPIPTGADAVVMIERSELSTDRTRVRITEQARPKQNIMSRGASMRAGDVVLRAGHDLRPPEIGLLAEIGRADVPVFPAARVAILATGNELVDAAIRPAAGQIRNSNGPLLAAAARRAGGIPYDLGIARDEPADLRAKIEQGLAADVLVISGGVSAGVLDLVPAVLRDLGVEQVFHKVSLKPGKPLWFGMRGSTFKVQSSGLQQLEPGTVDLKPATLVFGLPGNPVSSLVCCELFVRPAIAKLNGCDPSVGLRRLPAQLGSDFTHRGDRTTYFPAVARRQGERLIAEPVTWRGSADLRGVAEANVLAIFPAGDRVWQAGEDIDVLLL